MKIGNTGRVSAPTLRRRSASRSPGTQDFASRLAADPEVQSAGTAGPVESLSGLLAIQEVSDEPGRRRRALARGEFLLARLDDLRLALLAGTFPRHRLSELLATVRAGREEVGDPRLREILDEIELRAAVEVAKLGQRV